MANVWQITTGSKPAGGPAKPNAPLSTTELLELLAQGKIGADDLICMEGADVEITVSQFFGLPPQESAPKTETQPPQPEAHPKEEIPDWLADVAEQEAVHLRKEPVQPDWLEDVRQSENLGRQQQTAALAEAALDWLEDIRQIEESLVAAPAPLAPPAKSPVTPPSPAPPGPKIPPAPARLLAVPKPKEQPSGFDPETGQILDPAAYARFQKAQEERRRQEQQAQPTRSVAEVFLEAHRALQDWVDDPANRKLVARGELEPIRQSISIKQLLAYYENYGPVMQERLQKRLAFLVENRQKFLKAFA
jgi:hypothetical protein